jgi:hypothetical protein
VTSGARTRDLRAFIVRQVPSNVVRMTVKMTVSDCGISVDIDLGSAHEPSSLVGPDELSFIEDAPSHDCEKFNFAQSNWCIQLDV